MTKPVGTFRKYQDFNFKPATLELIAKINVIVNDYEARGIPMSLRQLYYQLVTRNVIENKDTEYNRIGGIVSDARLAGMLSWSALEDRNRTLMGLRQYDNPAHYVQLAFDLGDGGEEGDYRIDKWANQPICPEVWVEKAALEGVIGTICNQLQVNFFSCRGYNSQSEQWRAGRRFANYYRCGQRSMVFHLGDHDPSGIDMTRDNRERLAMFAGVDVPVVRLALNMPQIEELKPPPNPAKITDSRYGSYRQQFGDDSWELDALSPEYIYKLIEGAVLKARDQSKWDEMVAQEVDDLRLLQEVHGDLLQYT